MSARVGMRPPTPVYHGDVFLGEAHVLPFPTAPAKNGQFQFQFQFPNNEIRISHLSPFSERCPPISILQTVSPSSVRCKIIAARPPPATAPDQSLIHRLYSACFQELKTAVVILGNEELHLIAMSTNVEKSPCFWCWSVPPLLYNSCLALLNMRCLSIVFDLDETLIVANSTKSFEDKIEALTQRIAAEDDPVKVSGMSAELKRYLEDRSLLKQYVENDNVTDNGKLFSCQNEEVHPPFNGHSSIVRPVIRLQDKNIVLTRINPENRDTSVLVRLRPAWEELRSYLTAKGRKRFEVYVCTMAERDYALEIWRLLDPDAKLINSNQLVDRIVCVRSGCKKSLLNVFQGGDSHPKLSMVIDDRINVWDDKDQSRVHVVPAFAPYYAPQAETASALPVLCVARNVACSVRGAFFKEFDENFMRKIAGILYEGDLCELSSPDCSHYLLSEDLNSAPNNNRDMPVLDNVNGTEVKKLSQPAAFFELQSIQQRAQAAMPSLQGSKEGIMSPNPLSMPVLLEIGRKCDIKVEFKPLSSSFKEPQFSIEVLFNSERIGVGRGRTRKEAQIQAAENGLHYLSSHYTEFIGPGQGGGNKDFVKSNGENENGFLGFTIDAASDVISKNEAVLGSTKLDPVSAEDIKQLSIITSSIKDILCLGDDFNLGFQDCPPASIILNQGEYYFQVEVAGKVIGKAIATSKHGAMLQAAEDALGSVKSTTDLYTGNHSHTPRSLSPCSKDEVQGRKDI